MPYHIRITSKDLRRRSRDALELDKDEHWIEEHIAAPRRQGREIFVDGQVFTWDRIDKIHITWTDETSEQLLPQISARRSSEAMPEPMPDRWYVARDGRDVTGQFLTGPTGSHPRTDASPAMTFAANRKAVMVIYGHDKEANDALFDWLRAIGLQPREWNQLINATGAASPYIGQVLEQALEQVQAVVAFFTPDEHVIAAAASTEDESAWRLQARPNVLIEAGMALIAHPQRTVLAVLGNQELPSDLAGRHSVRLSHTNPTPLHDLATRLQRAGCDTDLSGADWLRPSRFPDRDHSPQAHQLDNPPTPLQRPAIAGASSKGAARTSHSSSDRQRRRARTFTGHTDDVWSVAFSPDGTLLASASSDKTARIWNLATGRCVRTLAEHIGAVFNADFHPDGALLATASGKTARTWDLATGECVHTLTGHTDSVVWEEFSPDGALLATASDDKTARIWNLATGECLHILKGHTTSIVQAAFSPDGALLATASNDNTARIWDLATGECARTLTDHIAEVWSVAFSPDGTRLATASSDKSARIWNLTTGRCVRTLTGHPQGVPTVTFNPDGTLLATASDDTTARIWNLTTGKCIRTLTGHTDSVFGVAFSPDGTLLATASRDKTIRIWNC